MPSSEERLALTGMLGDVMRESAQAAVSYVWSNAESLDIDTKLFEGKPRRKSALPRLTWRRS